MPRFRLSDICHQQFLEAGLPIQTHHHIRVTIADVYRKLPSLGVSIYAIDEIPGETEYRRVVTQLRQEHRIQKDKDFPAAAYRVNDLPDNDASAICALVDPFCYISHISAMEHYRLTDRRSKALHLTTYEQREWRKHAEKLVINEQHEYSPYLDGFYQTKLQRHAFPPVVRGRRINLHETKLVGQFVKIRNSAARISTIGQTFLDMLISPNSCGGMQHVLDVWQQEVQNFISDTLKTIDQHPSKILKVRAGYILEERLGISNDTIQNWKIYAQRGGSRKLDPSASFEPTYSEKWMISINV